MNPIKIEIDKIYKKIDKIAKKGNDNYIEYHIYIDDLIKKGKYAILLECMDLKFNYNGTFLDIPTLKKESWKEILFQTNTTIQDLKYNLLKSKGVYQQGLDYYKDIPLTSAKVIDSSGKGAELTPIVIDGFVSSIRVTKTGSNYSASASIIISGGIGTASASPVVRAGKIYLVNIGLTGSGHNQSYKIGKITEHDIYQENIGIKVTNDLYQKIIGNKTTLLVATKDGLTQSATFSSWNSDFTYDKNLSNLYNKAINYLLI